MDDRTIEAAAGSASAAVGVDEQLHRRVRTGPDIKPKQSADRSLTPASVLAKCFERYRIRSRVKQHERSRRSGRSHGNGFLSVFASNAHIEVAHQGSAIVAHRNDTQATSRSRTRYMLATLGPGRHVTAVTGMQQWSPSCGS